MSADSGLRRAWYVLARSSDVKPGEVVRRELLGRPIAVFRGNGGAAQALADACPHRGHPLSEGTVLGDQLRCNYHGWRFGTGGRCELVPGLDPGRRPVKPACAPAHETREQNGLVWAWGEPGVTPLGDPMSLPLSRDSRYETSALSFGVFPASADLILDNFMDSAHPAFVHRGLLNSDTKRFLIGVDIHDCVHRDGERQWRGLECAYLDEPFGDFSWFIKLFGKRSARAEIAHFERYFPPSMHQFEYRTGRHHFVSTQFLTPETETRTRVHVVYHWDFSMPAWLSRWPLRGMFSLLLEQDRRLLRKLQQNLERFPERRQASTSLDAFGQLVLRDREAMSSGAAPLAAPVKQLKFSVNL